LLILAFGYWQQMASAGIAPHLSWDDAPMARTTFTKNLSKAIKQIINDGKLGLDETRSGSLYSPVFSSDYKWAKIMDSDGLLVGRRSVKEDGDAGATPAIGVYLRIGVVIQSEESTSQTKPNPFGKAAIGTIRNGIWVDLKMGERGRPAE
jgi:hypothetical protein